MATKPNFDPVAMGLVPLYGNAGFRSGWGDTSEDYQQGEQTGWGKDLPGGKVINYDMDGNVTVEGDKHHGLTNGQMAMMFLGGSALGAGLIGSAAGGAEAAAAVGESAGYGGYGGLTGSLSSGLTAGGDAMLGGSLAEGAAGYGGVSGSLGSSFGGGEFLNQSSLGWLDAGDSAVEVGGGAGGPGMLEEPTSTLGTLSGSGYTPAVGDAGLASNVTSGGLNSLNAAGVNAAEFAGVTGALNATGGGGFMDTLKNAFSAVNEWAKENPLWTNMLGGMGAMVNGVLNRENNLDVVKEQGKNQIDLEKLKEEERLAKNKTYSQSIAGLRVPGLINARPVDPASRMPAFSGLINARG